MMMDKAPLLTETVASLLPTNHRDHSAWTYDPRVEQSDDNADQPLQIEIFRGSREARARLAGAFEKAGMAVNWNPGNLSGGLMPWVAVTLSDPLVPAIEAAESRIVEMWEKWPQGQRGLLMLGTGSSDWPAFFLQREYTDVRAALAAVTGVTAAIVAEPEVYGRHHWFLWENAAWHSVSQKRIFAIGRSDQDDDERRQGSGDRSPLLGDGPHGTMGAKADVPDQPS